MYEILSRIYPERQREKIKRLMRCSTVKVKFDDFIGFAVLFSILIASLLSLIILKLTKISLPYAMIAAAIFFVILQACFYLFLVLNADSKAKFVESILPDALQLTASNLKAGFTVERALLLSARPEFGYLSDELSIVGREIATGKNMEETMMGMTKKIRSRRFEKTIMLIVNGIRSGGELAVLLSQTAQNLRNQMLVEERMKASALAYFIFIMSAVAFAAPVLFALSSFLAEVIKKQISLIEIPRGVAIPIVVTDIAIGNNFILAFIVITLTTLCIFGSFALGFIKKGDLKEGVKYIPLLLTSSLTIFFGVRFIIKRILGDLI